MGGQTLAKHYRAPGKPSGRSVFLGIALLNSVQYKGVLSGTITPDGLYLSVLFLFGIGAAPLLLPWTAFQVLTPEKILWGTQYRFQIRAGSDTIEFAVQNEAFAKTITEWIRYAGDASSGAVIEGRVIPQYRRDAEA